MNSALIDIGSNSMRLSVYELSNGSFRTLFREKIMAGLAGFVVKKKLTPEGIDRACDGLLRFREGSPGPVGQNRLWGNGRLSGRHRQLYWPHPH